MDSLKFPIRRVEFPSFTMEPVSVAPMSRPLSTALIFGISNHDTAPIADQPPVKAVGGRLKDFDPLW